MKQKSAPVKAVRRIVPGLLLISVSACVQLPPTHESSPRETLPMTPASDNADPLEAIEQHAIRDLSQRLAISAADIRVLSHQAVTWSDGALGCPQPDFVYTQALVPGFHVVLAVGGAEYHYHAGSHGRPFLCPDDRRKAPLQSGPGAATHSKTRR